MLSPKVWVGLLAGVCLAACAVAPVTPPLPPTFDDAVVISAATDSAPVGVAVLAPSATTGGLGDEGLVATLKNYGGAIGSDPTGMKTAAFTTLQDFTNPHGIYSRSWWLTDDGRAEITDVLAVILYTEGNTNWDVRTAVAARYLWYCGGLGSGCQGAALINFLSYFQPWRQPWNTPGFTSENAQQYKSLAADLVNQRAGPLTAMIPGADTYVHSNAGLSIAGSIDWFHTAFHFANVDLTWDGFLRLELRRLPNGPARLWVLTMGEAQRVCGSEFVCTDMTQPRG